jgi:hypothetical protein
MLISLRDGREIRLYRHKMTEDLERYNLTPHLFNVVEQLALQKVRLFGEKEEESDLAQHDYLITQELMYEFQEAWKLLRKRKRRRRRRPPKRQELA